MRSLIYVDVAREEYRVRLLHWLYNHHIQDSISQFQPYVTKYAFYPALPTPPEGERFGTARLQLTEHYWLVNPFCGEMANKTFTEYFPLEVLKWQGNIPDDAGWHTEVTDGDSARASKGEGGASPFLFAFVPLCWEVDLKGKERTPVDGPNYRWQFCISLPEGVSEEEMDKWLFDDVLPYFAQQPETLRVVSSKVKQEVNDCAFYRVVELWFEGPDEWYKVAVEGTKDFKKPGWAQQDAFPHLAPRQNIQSLFLADIARSDNLTQHRGWITMR